MKTVRNTISAALLLGAALALSGTASGTTTDAPSVATRATAGEELEGTPGPDRFVGDAGSDWVYGRGGDDYLRGNGGDDVLDGDRGADVVDGGSGDDSVYGDAGADWLFGAGGRDIVSAGRGADRLYAGPGDDDLVDGPGRDRVWAGAGDDRIHYSKDGRKDVFRCGRGTDTVRVTSAHGAPLEESDFDPQDVFVGCERTRLAL